LTTSKSKENNNINPVNSYSLYFNNISLEENFIKMNLPLLKKKNIGVSILGLIISLIILILFVICNLMKNNELLTLNLILEPVSNSTLTTSIITDSDELKPEFLFLGKFLVVNQTKLNIEKATKLECLISINNPEVLQTVKDIIFFKNAIIIVSILVCFHILCFVVSFFAKKNICQNINLLFITLIFNHAFYIVSGMLVVIYKFSAEVIYILIALNVLLKLTLHLSKLQIGDYFQ
jgi:hypothetical protein